MIRRSAPLPALAAAATGILVGAALVATRSVATAIPPGSLALLRYTIGCLCLLPAFALRRRVRPPILEALKIAGLGILQFAVVVGLLNLSLRSIPSARAALLFSLCPILTLVLEACMQRRIPSVTSAAGAVMALGGVAIAFGWGAVQGPQGMSWTGEGAAGLSALVAAVCSLSYRPFLERHGPLTVGVYALPAAVVVLAGVAAFEGLFTAPFHLPPSGWLAVAFIGVGSGVGYYLWLWALDRASPTRITVFLTLNPIAAGLLGVLLLGERVGSSFVVGVACVVIGVWVAYRTPSVAPNR